MFRNYLSKFCTKYKVKRSYKLSYKYVAKQIIDKLLMNITSTGHKTQMVHQSNPISKAHMVTS